MYDGSPARAGVEQVPEKVRRLATDTFKVNCIPIQDCDLFSYFHILDGKWRKNFGIRKEPRLLAGYII